MREKILLLALLSVLVLAFSCGCMDSGDSGDGNGNETEENGDGNETKENGDGTGDDDIGDDDDENGEPVVLVFDCEIEVYDTEDDEIHLTLVSGDQVDWSEYGLTVDGSSGFETDSQSANVGVRTIFKDTTGTWDPQVGTQYNIRLTEISSQNVVFQNDVMARYG